MSFKSKKSPVLEELEKIAIQKGLVTVSVLDKIASMPKKQNYVVTENFDENIIKLCSGLREKGFYDQASLLEEDYVICKQAETAYKDSLDYKKLHDAAHAKVTKLKGIDGDSEVEDIFEIKRKIMDVVNKQPKSKYATLISKIKKEALRLGGNEAADDVKIILTSLNGIANLLATCENNEELNVRQFISPVLDEIKVFRSFDDELSQGNILSLINLLNKMKPLLTSWGANELVGDEQKTFLNLRSQILSSCNNLLSKINEVDNSTNIDKYMSFRTRLDQCKEKMNTYKSSIENSDQFTKNPKLNKYKVEIFNPIMSDINSEIFNVDRMLRARNVAIETISNQIVKIEAKLEKIYNAFIK